MCERTLEDVENELAMHRQSVQGLLREGAQRVLRASGSMTVAVAWVRDASGLTWEQAGKMVAAAAREPQLTLSVRTRRVAEIAEALASVALDAQCGGDVRCDEDRVFFSRTLYALLQERRGRVHASGEWLVLGDRGYPISGLRQEPSHAD
jgi:hypothetical protein